MIVESMEMNGVILILLVMKMVGCVFFIVR